MVSLLRKPRTKGLAIHSYGLWGPEEGKEEELGVEKIGHLD